MLRGAGSGRSVLQSERSDDDEKGEWGGVPAGPQEALSQGPLAPEV